MPTASFSGGVDKPSAMRALRPAFELKPGPSAFDTALT
jgi:hypothetical protein